MIAGRHHDDETLIRLLSRVDAELDPHLAVCTLCSNSLESYRAILDVLRQETTWSAREIPAPDDSATIGALRAFAARSALDADAAREILFELRSRPVGEWRKAVASDRRFHNPAMVAELVAASEAAIDRAPADAVTIGRLAVEVAGRLTPGANDGGVVARAHGAAWRQFAYASFYVGDYPAAAEAVQRARQELAACAVADYDLARNAIVDALVLAAQERYEEARSAARDAATVFHRFGDRVRYASAKTAEACSLLAQQRYDEAVPILETLEREYCDDSDRAACAAVLTNLAIAYAETGRLHEALEQYETAAATYDALGNAFEAARVRYNCAHTLARNGRAAEAMQGLRAARSEFLRLGITHLAACAGLEIATLLLAENASAEAAALCSEAVEQLQTMGRGAATDGLTALALLRDSTARGEITPQVVAEVRRVLGWGSDERRLIFAVI